MTVEEVAKLKDCSPRAVYNAINGGKLKAEKRPSATGRGRMSWFVRKADALKWKRPEQSEWLRKDDGDKRRNRVLVSMTDAEYQQLLGDVGDGESKCDTVRRWMGLDG